MRKLHKTTAVAFALRIDHLASYEPLCHVWLALARDYEITRFWMYHRWVYITAKLKHVHGNKRGERRCSHIPRNFRGCFRTNRAAAISRRRAIVAAVASKPRHSPTESNPSFYTPCIRAAEITTFEGRVEIYERFRDFTPSSRAIVAPRACGSSHSASVEKYQNADVTLYRGALL